MCRDFSYLVDKHGNIWRHKTSFRCHSHSIIFQSNNRGLYSRNKIPWGSESNYARYEHTRHVLDHKMINIKLDEMISPLWLNTTLQRASEKYGEAARKINWQFKEWQLKKDIGFSLSPDFKHNTIKIKWDQRNKYQKRTKIRWTNNPNPIFIKSVPFLNPRQFKNREAFRKACLEQKIPTRLADLVYSTPADVIFGKLNKHNLAKYL